MTRPRTVRSAFGAARGRARLLLARGRVRGDHGMTTAEYAIGTLAAAGFAALLLTILHGSAVRGLLLGLVTKALSLGG
ncbi:DUF4244 domain-containing protein [Angustibacter aerolatus]|uniref:DUF4244 domain-containing protein n=1 Tax=Angustibacter aerolatus TaxID=1162965 RepID=A0ABQ6JI91_9ACTN|nr:DUF4244 domain-containing protein [Angustibacter aerolatus]GMA86582.1 hypothetical protein GCM10025868_18320 [Angustibacter aerolatus]